MVTIIRTKWLELASPYSIPDCYAWRRILTRHLAEELGCFQGNYLAKVNVSSRTTIQHVGNEVLPPIATSQIEYSKRELLPRWKQHTAVVLYFVSLMIWSPILSPYTKWNFPPNPMDMWSWKGQSGIKIANGGKHCLRGEHMTDPVLKHVKHDVRKVIADATAMEKLEEVGVSEVTEWVAFLAQMRVQQTRALADRMHCEPPKRLTCGTAQMEMAGR